MKQDIHSVTDDTSEARDKLVEIQETLQEYLHYSSIETTRMYIDTVTVKSAPEV